MDVWRFVGTAAILTYSCSAIPNDIWFKRPSVTNVVDGIVYGLVCGLIFASLWPKRRTEAFRERLGALQDVLGQMNDAAVARALVGDILAAQSNTADAKAVAYAAGVVVGWHVGHLRERAEKLEKRWLAFAAAVPPWKR